MAEVDTIMADDVTKKIDAEETVKVDSTIENVQEEKNVEKEEKEKVAVECEKKTDKHLTKLESDIIRQIEYYFGDSNLGRDKFLSEQITKDEGWVPVPVLLTFKRLASLSEDPKVIVDAIDKSDEGLVEVSEDRLKLRRHPERPLAEQNEEYRKKVMARTAYVKGFPTTGVEMSDVIEFMSSYDKVVNIAMRKYHDKPTKNYMFKGSILVTFAERDQCAEFIKKDKIQYKENVLIRKWHEDYLEEKKEERSHKGKKGKGSQKEDIGFNLPKGSVIFAEGFAAGTVREDIKEAISSIGGDVAYIEFNKGDEIAHIRLTEENSAKTVFEKMDDGKFKVNDKEIKARILEGDEEKEFLVKVVQNMKSRRQQPHRGGRRQQYGNFNRKRKGSHDRNNEPKSKY